MMNRPNASKTWSNRIMRKLKKKAKINKLNKSPSKITKWTRLSLNITRMSNSNRANRLRNKEMMSHKIKKKLLLIALIYQLKNKKMKRLLNLWISIWSN